MATSTFKEFCRAEDFLHILRLFKELCRQLGIDREQNNVDNDYIYTKIKNNLNCRDAINLFALLDLRKVKTEYGVNGDRPCLNTKILIVGAGPCGLRMAIECALLGAKVVVCEGRGHMSRNNVLHLWPFIVHDIKAQGAKIFHPTFGTGLVNHISIRRLQTILLKTALILGVEVHAPVQCCGLVEPDINKNTSWMAYFRPNDHQLNEYEFDIAVTADGRADSLNVVERRCFQSKQAIAITANFQNHRTKHENWIQEIPGYNYIVHADFFNNIRDEHGIELENLVYYKGDTHYFVMTATKNCLLNKGVLKKNHPACADLLSAGNVQQSALTAFCSELAQATSGIRHTDFAKNHHDQEDVAIFDFSKRYQATKACTVKQKNGHQLLVAIVGDALLEPFWPEGTGCARGFLGVLDTAWTIRSWALQERTQEQLLSEREDAFKLLSQTTPNNLSKKYDQYTIDPKSRYGARLRYRKINPRDSIINLRKKDMTGKNLEARKSVADNVDFTENTGVTGILEWYQNRLSPYKHLVTIRNFNISWRDGVALELLIEDYQEQLGYFDKSSKTNKSATEKHTASFSFIYRKFGISPPMAPRKMLYLDENNNLGFITYLTQLKECLYQGRRLSYFRRSSRPLIGLENQSLLAGNGDSSTLNVPQHNPQRRRSSALVNINKLWQTFRRKSVVHQKVEKPKKSESRLSSLKKASSYGSTDNLVNLPDYDNCCACNKPLYVIERQTAHGLVFHRQCYRCSLCRSKLYVLSEVAVVTAPDKSNTRFYCKRHAPSSPATSPITSPVSSPVSSPAQPESAIRKQEQSNYENWPIAETEEENLYTEIPTLLEEDNVQRITQTIRHGLKISDDEESDSTGSEEEDQTSGASGNETSCDRMTRRASQRLIRAYRIQTSVQEATDEEEKLEETGLNLEKLLTRRTSVEAHNDTAVQKWIGVVTRKQQIIHNQRKMQLQAKFLELRDNYFRLQRDLFSDEGSDPVAPTSPSTDDSNRLNDQIKDTTEQIKLLSESLKNIGS